MPQSIVPAFVRIDDTVNNGTGVKVSDAKAEFDNGRLHEVAERINKQLEQVTGLELEEGDL